MSQTIQLNNQILERPIPSLPIGARKQRVGVAALGNSVFRVECICMGVGPRHALLTLCGFWSAPWFGLPVPGRVGSFCGLPGLSVWVGSPFVRPVGLPGPVGFVLWAPGFPHICAAGFLVLLVRARGLACM